MRYLESKLRGVLFFRSVHGLPARIHAMGGRVQTQQLPQHRLNYRFLPDLPKRFQQSSRSMRAHTSTQLPGLQCLPVPVLHHDTLPDFKRTVLSHDSFLQDGRSPNRSLLDLHRRLHLLLSAVHPSDCELLGLLALSGCLRYLQSTLLPCQPRHQMRLHGHQLSPSSQRE
jgi:hypothetical protein